MLALGVSLCSLDYIIDDDLKSFRLAPVDDDEDTSFPSVVSTPSTMVPLRPIVGVTPLMAPALARTVPIPRGKPDLLWQFYIHTFLLTFCTIFASCCDFPVTNF